MRWCRTWRADPVGRVLADRHYSRKTPGASQYAPPGRNLTLRTAEGDALWVASWPLPEYVDHAWGDCWTCTLFRNESAHLSSELIHEAVAASMAKWGPPPAGGYLTFVDEGKVASSNPGYCFLCAGWRKIGRTKDRNLLVLRLEVADFPPTGRDALELQMGVDGGRMSDEPQWPPYTARTFRCSCGEEIGVSDDPARSTVDGRELGPRYLALAPDSLSGAVLLWKVGTGDAGFYDQRCPGCDALLVAPPDQEALF